METIGVVDTWNLTTLGLVLFLGMMLAREAGYRLGLSRRHHSEKPDEGVAVLIGGLLGLMSFVLAFNLSTSTTRLEDRRHAALEEATAISTAWLQAQALADNAGSAIAGMLEQYLSARRDFALYAEGSPQTEAAVRATARLQVEIWKRMSVVLAARPDPQAVSLANALTHTFDMTTFQTLAISTGLPARLVWLLLISSALAICGLGYYLGLMGRPRLGLSVVLALLWSGVTTLIIDLGSPRIGMINTDVRPYDWTEQGFAEFRKYDR